MGFYATLRHPLVCARCGEREEAASQFRLGACNDLPVYRLGEALEWEGPKATRFGTAAIGADCVCVGYPSVCEWCGAERVTSVVVRDQTFVEARHRHGYGWEPEDTLVGPERRGVGEVLRGDPWRLPRGDGRELHVEWDGDRLVRVRGRPIESVLDYLHERDAERMFALRVFWWLWSDGALFELDAERDGDGRLLVRFTRAQSAEEIPSPMRPFAEALAGSLPWDTTVLAEEFARSTRGPLQWALSEIEASEASDEARSLAAKSFELLRHEAHPTLAAVRETLRTLRYAIELPFVL